MNWLKKLESNEDWIKRHSKGENLPSCHICGKKDYITEKALGKDVPAGCVVNFDDGGRLWLCHDCSKDPEIMKGMEEGDL